MSFISITFIVGYASLITDSFSFVGISSLLMSFLLPFSNNYDIKQSIFALLFLR